MKRQLHWIFLLMGLFVAGNAFADPPECVGPPDWAGPKDRGLDPPDPVGGNGRVPPPKSWILHCGCTEDGQSMEYVAIRVSSRARGHDLHIADTVESCFDGVDTYIDFLRTGSDCQLDGEPLGGAIQPCSDQLEFDVCGEPANDG